MMSTAVREIPQFAEPTLDLDEVCAEGTRIVWPASILLIIAFLAVLFWAATSDPGYATPRDPVPPAMQSKEART